VLGEPGTDLLEASFAGSRGDDDVERRVLFMIQSDAVVQTRRSR
jgi:hypothetical protein